MISQCLTTELYPSGPSLSIIELVVQSFVVAVIFVHSRMFTNSPTSNCVCCFLPRSFPIVIARTPLDVVISSLGGSNLTQEVKLPL